MVLIKQIISILTIILLIALAGCTKQYVCHDGITVSDPGMCKEEEKAAEEPEELIEEEIKEIDREIQEFIDDVNTYDNYQFRYKGPDSAYSMEVLVKEDRIRYYFKDYTKEHNKFEFYDSVVLDTSQKTAYQYCNNKAKCSDENMEFTRQVDYGSRKIPTMQDVMNSLIKAKIIGDEMMMDRSSKKVDYTDDQGITGTLWIDKFFGIPLRKEYTLDGKDVSEVFDGFSKGAVTEGMVTVPAHLEVK